MNGEAENRRGRKLVAGDEVIIDGQGSYIISKR
ncbi:MAG: RNA-binding S4 domain-containing protein [Tuberibacillus sp.]